MKYCGSCRKLKKRSDFHKHVQHADGLASTCKSCHRKKMKAVYHRTEKTPKVRERHRQKMARWRTSQENRDKQNARRRELRAERNRIKAIREAFADAHAEPRDIKEVFDMEAWNLRAKESTLHITKRFERVHGQV